MTLARRRARNLRAARRRARVVPQTARLGGFARRRREPHRRRTRRRRRPSRARERAVVCFGRPGRAAVPPGLGPEARGRASARSPRRRRAVLGCGRQTRNAAEFPAPSGFARALRRGDGLGTAPPEAHQRYDRAQTSSRPRAGGNAPGALGTPRARVVHFPRRAARRRPRGAVAAAAAARGAPAVGVHPAPAALRAERPPGLVHRPPEGEHACPRAFRGARIRRASRIRPRIVSVGAEARDGHRREGRAIEPVPSGARFRGVTAGVRTRASRFSPRDETTSGSRASGDAP